jgi:hypothetical protein
MPSDASRKARHEFHKSPPCKAGFCISGDLLGCFPPPFDQLQCCLAAAPQTVAFLEFVEQSDRLSRQLEQHFLIAGSAQPLAVGLGSLGRGWIFGFRHRRTRI